MRLILVISLVLLIGCTAPLSSIGSQVEVVSEKTKDSDCEFIDIITAKWEMNDTESAMNVAREKVAELGGNAMHIVNIDYDEWNAIVVAEALNCNSLPQIDKSSLDESEKTYHDTKGGNTLIFILLMVGAGVGGYLSAQ